MGVALECLGQISAYDQLESLGVVELVKKIVHYSISSTDISISERVGALECVKLLETNSETADDLWKAGMVVYRMCLECNIS